MLGGEGEFETVGNRGELPPDLFGNVCRMVVEHLTHLLVELRIPSLEVVVELVRTDLVTRQYLGHRPSVSDRPNGATDDRHNGATKSG